MIIYWIATVSVCLYVCVCAWFVLVPLLVNFLALSTSIFAIPMYFYYYVSYHLEFVCFVFRSSALIGPFHLHTLHLLHYIHNFLEFSRRICSCECVFDMMPLEYFFFFLSFHFVFALLSSSIIQSFFPSY